MRPIKFLFLTLLVLLTFNSLTFAQKSKQVTEDDLEAEMNNYRGQLQKQIDGLPSPIKNQIKQIEQGENPMDIGKLMDGKDTINKFLNDIKNEDGSLKKDFYKQLYKSEHLDEVLKFNQELMANVTDEDLRTKILTKTEGTPFHQFLLDNPKVVTFVVRFLKDKEALRSIVKGIRNPEKLKIYGGIALSLGIIGFILRRRRIEGHNFIDRISRQIFIMITFSMLGMMAFVAVFFKELKPTIKIGKDVFF